MNILYSSSTLNTAIQICAFQQFKATARIHSSFELILIKYRSDYTVHVSHQTAFNNIINNNNNTHSKQANREFVSEVIWLLTDHWNKSDEEH